MNRKEFYSYIVKELPNYFQEKVTLSLQKVNKNNGVVLQGLTISRENSTITPNIYLNEIYLAYKSGVSMEELLLGIVEIYDKKTFQEQGDLQNFSDYSKAKKRLAFKLVNFEKNKALLKKVPHLPFHDLAMVFYYLLEKSTLSNASILIHKHHMNQWGVRITELVRDAVCNTPVILPAKIRTMEEVMRGMFAEDLKKEFSGLKEDSGFLEPDEEWYERAAGQMVRPMIDPSVEPLMFVAGNTEKLFGAAVIAYENLLEDFSDQIKQSFYILPCSVHEVILIPDHSGVQVDQLKQMVCEVNATQLDPEDFLSDSIYYYRAGSGQVQHVC